MYQPCVALGRKGPIRHYRATAALLGHKPGCYMSFEPHRRYAGGFSVEAWVRPSSATKDLQTFFDSRAPYGEYSVDFKLTGTLNPYPPAGQAVCADIGNGREWLAEHQCSPFPFRAHRWYYLALTVHATTGAPGVATFFINGRAVRSIQLPRGLPLLTDSAHPIAIGDNPRYDYRGNPNPENFDGIVGQVAVYQYTLSFRQVAAHYATGRIG
jgi:hypothetical protein